MIKQYIKKMIVGISFSFLAAFLYGITNMIDSHISNGMFKRVATVTFYNGCFNFMGALIVLIFFGLPHALDLSSLLILLSLGLINVLYTVPYYHALRKTDTSVIAASFSIGYGFVPILAFFVVGEVLKLPQYIGFFIIIIFSLILNVESWKKFKINAGFYLMCLSSLLLATQLVLFKYALENISWITTAFYMSLFTACFIFCILFFSSFRGDIKEDFFVFKSNVKLLVLNTLFFEVANICSIFALISVPVVVYEGIRSSQSIMVLVLSALIACHGFCPITETTNKVEIAKKLICFIFIIIGVILIV